MAEIAQENVAAPPAVAARTLALARREVVALSLVTLLGLAVRLQGLTDYGIWFDEGYHIAVVKLSTVGAMLDAVLSNPPSDPLYVLLLRGWIAIFGSSDAAVRSLSVLLATATLPATYWLGRLLSGGAVGLLGALFFALAPYGVELGQEAALYTLAALTTTATLAAGWRWRSTGRGMWLYFIVGVAAIYSHYVVAAILGLFAILGLSRIWGERRVETRPWLLANLGIALAWLPWLVALAVYWLSSPMPRTARMEPATWSDLYGALVQMSAGSPPLYVPGVLLERLGLLAGGLLFALGLLRGGGGLRLLAFVAAVIFAAPAIASALTGWWLFVSHFMLFLMPSLYLVLAAGALALLRLDNRSLKALGAGLLGLWLGVQVSGLWHYYRYPPHGADGLRELAAVLRARPTEVVLVTPPALSATLQQYYQGTIMGLPSDFDLRAIYFPHDPEEWNAQSLERLQLEVSGKERFWLVYRPELDRGGEFLAAVKGAYTLLAQHDYSYATIYLLEAP